MQANLAEGQNGYAPSTASCQCSEGNVRGAIAPAEGTKMVGKVLGAGHALWQNYGHTRKLPPRILCIGLGNNEVLVDGKNQLASVSCFLFVSLRNYYIVD